MWTAPPRSKNGLVCVTVTCLMMLAACDQFALVGTLGNAAAAGGLDATVRQAQDGSLPDFSTDAADLPAGWWNDASVDKSCNFLPGSACGQTCGSDAGPCALECDVIAACTANCEPGSTCYARCASIGTCSLSCAEGARCWYETVSGGAFVTCARGSMCDVKCPLNASCSVTCESGAACMLHCSGVGCDLKCPHAPLSCADGAMACGRPCASNS